MGPALRVRLNTPPTHNREPCTVRLNTPAVRTPDRAPRACSRPTPVMSFSSTDCGWKDEWATVRAAREARTAAKKNIHKGLGAGAKAAAAAAAAAAAPAKAAAAAAAAAKAAEKAAAKEAAKEAARVAAAEAAAAEAAAEAAKKAAYASGSHVSAPQYQPGDVEVSGCGREGVNGTYRRSGVRDGVPCYRRVGGGRHRPAYTIERTTGETREWSSTVQCAPLGSTRARLSCLLAVRLAALGSSALPGRRPALWLPRHHLRLEPAASTAADPRTCGVCSPHM